MEQAIHTLLDNLSFVGYRILHQSVRDYNYEGTYTSYCKLLVIGNAEPRFAATNTISHQICFIMSDCTTEILYRNGNGIHQIKCPYQPVLTSRCLPRLLLMA